MRCNQCGNEVEISAKFCPNCGRALPDIINPQNNVNLSPIGCILKAFLLIVFFLIVCIVIAMLFLALPWLILIGLVLIGLGMLSFFFSGI